MMPPARPIALPHSPRRRISILGATGSIGDSCLRVIEQHPKRFELVALTAQNNAEKLIALAKKFRPALVAIGNASQATQVTQALTPLGITVLVGSEGIEEAAQMPCDISVAAIVGVAGLMPTLRAIEQGNAVALANKEALVCAGDLVMQTCTTHGTRLLPIDSEHNAIFQVLAHEHRGQIEKITLTASGGPLLHQPLSSLTGVTPEEAINHPRWRMGAKISVDSATMMNKALELIEAHYLFALPASRIEVVIHPQSIIHGLVHYSDGSVLAQLAMPDMAIPIAHALGWPERLDVTTPRLDLASIGILEFMPLDATRFPAITLAREALAASQAHVIALNAANEIAVEKFLERTITFPRIAQCVADVVACTQSTPVHSIADVLEIDQQSRRLSHEILACNS